MLPLQQICAICSLVKWCSKAGRRRRRHLGQLVSFFPLCITEKRCGLCALCLLTRVMRTQNTLVLNGDMKLGACWCTSFLSQHYIRARQSGFQSFKFIPAKAAVHLIAAQTRAAYRLIYFKRMRCPAGRFISEFGT